MAICNAEATGLNSRRNSNTSRLSVVSIFDGRVKLPNTIKLIQANKAGIETLMQEMA